LKLLLFRFASLEDSTLSALYVDGQFTCFGLEDEFREVKVPGETRIPAGTYKLSLQTVGRLHEKYLMRFPAEHRGMIVLRDVPGFTGIMIHTGVTDDDTEGCILVGDGAHVGGTLSESTICYRRIYGQISNAILAGEPVEIEVKDGA